MMAAAVVSKKGIPMKYRIEAVRDNSILEEMGVAAGDFLIAINGNPVLDELDIEFFAADENLLVEIEKPDGERWELEIEKDPGEDLGLIERPSNQIRRCNNGCVFCFIDQMPPGMRDTLYIKDDDERMSFLYGNYITLTNLSEAEKERIVRYRIMPINISVHTTNPELRRRMLRNRFAGSVMADLQFFKEHEIAMNSQIVLCPQLNDGEELKRTLADLAGLYPQMRSVSVVPLGMTKYRRGLAPLKSVSREKARETIAIIEACQRDMLAAHGVHFVYPADEFFLLAERPIPEAKYYEDFTQLENGVGMLAAFEQEVQNDLAALAPLTRKATVKKIGIITGVLAKPMLQSACEAIHAAFPHITFEVTAIQNRFFGKAITVAGLITGRDILSQMDGKTCDQYFLPENMVKFGTHLFLDDITTEDLSAKWGKPVTIVPVDGRAFVNRALGLPDPTDEVYGAVSGYEPEV